MRDETLAGMTAMTDAIELPHPHLPCTPEVLKVAAPIAGAADRIRDALAGRHRD